MGKYIACFFSVMLFFSACTEDGPPAYVIPHERMISLLTDLHTLDGTMYNVAQVPDSMYKYGTGQYLALFKKYHTDSAAFRKSFKYYSARPAELRTMYDKVLVNLTKRTDSVRNTQLKQKNAAPVQ